MKLSETEGSEILLESCYNSFENETEINETSEIFSLEIITPTPPLSPTKTPIIYIPGIIVQENCEGSEYLYCLTPDIVSKFDLSQIKSENNVYTIYIATNLTKTQTFNFSNYNKDYSLTIQGVSPDNYLVDFTIKIRNYVFNSLELVNLTLSFDTNLTKYFQFNEIIFDNVNLDIECNYVIFSKFTDITGLTEEEINCFKEKVINKPPPTKYLIEVFGENSKCTEKAPDDTYQAVCINASDVNDYNFSNVPDSISLFHIILKEELDDGVGFNFATILKPKSFIITTNEKPDKNDPDGFGYTLDLTKIGSLVDSLEITNLNLSFHVDQDHFILNVDTFVLANLIDLGTSAKKVNISLVKNIDFDEDYVPEFMTAEDEPKRESISVNIKDEINEVIVNGSLIIIITKDNEGNFSVKEVNTSITNEVVIKVPVLEEGSKPDITITIETPSPEKKMITFEGTISVKIDELIQDDTNIEIGFKSSKQNDNFAVFYPSYDIPVSVLSPGVLTITITNESLKTTEDIILNKVVSERSGKTEIVVPPSVTDIYLEKLSVNTFSISKQREATDSKILHDDEDNITININELIINDFQISTFTNPLIINKGLSIGVLGQLVSEELNFTKNAEFIATYYEGYMYEMIVKTKEEVGDFPIMVKLHKSNYTMEGGVKPTLFNIFKISEEDLGKIALVDSNSNYEKLYSNGYLAALLEINDEIVEKPIAPDVEESPTPEDNNVGLIVGVVVGCVVLVVIIIIVVYFLVIKKNKDYSSSSLSSSISSL